MAFREAPISPDEKSSLKLAMYIYILNYALLFIAK